MIFKDLGWVEGDRMLSSEKVLPFEMSLMRVVEGREPRMRICCFRETIDVGFVIWRGNFVPLRVMVTETVIKLGVGLC